MVDPHSVFFDNTEAKFELVDVVIPWCCLLPKGVPTIHVSFSSAECQQSKPFLCLRRFNIQSHQNKCCLSDLSAFRVPLKICNQKDYKSSCILIIKIVPLCGQIVNCLTRKAWTIFGLYLQQPPGRQGVVFIFEVVSLWD